MHLSSAIRGVVFIGVSASLLACSALSKRKEGYEGFGRESLSQAQLEKFAPPSIDPALKNKIEKYMDIRSPGSSVLSPGARKLYVNWSVTGTNQVWRLDGPKNFPVQMTGGEDATYVQEVSPNGRWIAVTRDSMGDEFYAVYLQSSKGGSLVEVFKKPKVRASFQNFSNDSNWVYYAANDIEESSYAIYRYNIGSGKRELIFSEPGIWRIGDYKDDSNLILVKHVGSMQNEHFHFNPKTKKLTPIIGQDKKEDFQVAFSRQPNEYYVLTDLLRDFRTLYLFKEGKLLPITENWDFNVEYFRMDDDRRKMVFSTNEKGYYRARAIWTKTLKEIPLPKFKGAEQVYAGAFSRDGRYMTLSVETAQSPGQSYVYDFNTGKLNQWVLSSSPEVDTSQFVGAELDSYRAEDGTQIPMFVWRSEECKKVACPVIVYFHGGPESQFTPGFSTTVNLFLEKGFVFAAPNVRGSDGYGKTWVRADNGPKRLEVITDIRDAARYIKSKWKVKEVAPKVGIYGGSYGGYSTLVGMTMFAGEYDAGVANVGMSSLLTFLQNTAPYRRELRVNEYGDPEKDREALIQLSPITYVEQVQDPILILHGATDPRVPAGEAVQFYEQIKDKVPGSEMIIFPDEGHGVKKRPNRVLMLGYVIDFFKKHLQDKPGS